MKRFTTALVVAVFFCGLAVRPARCAEMAEFVPADALLYIETDGEAAQALLSLAAMPPVAAMFLPQATDPFGYADGPLHLPAGTLSQTAPHVAGLAFALVGEDPLFLLTFDDEAGPGRLLQGREPGADGMTELWDRGAVCSARGNLLAIGTRAGLGAMPGVPQGSLAAAATYQDALTKTEESPLKVYAAVPPLLNAIRSSLSTYDRDGFDAFTWLSGLDKADYLVTSLGGSNAFPWLDPAGDAPMFEPTESRVTLHFADESAMILRLLPELPMQVAADVPADTALTVALNWGDAAAFIGSLREMVSQMNAVGGGGGQGPDPFAMIEGMLGMSLDQFAATLGSGLAVSLSAGTGTPMIGRQDWTAVLPLTDAAAFRTALDGIARNTMGAPLATVEQGGLSIMQLPMAPVFLHVADDVLVISGSPDNLAAYMEWRESADRKSMEAGDRPLAVLLRADLGRLLVSYPTTGSGTKMIVSLAREGADLNLDMATTDLNPNQFIAEYMHGYTGVLFGMMMPALSRARGEARKAVDKANLHNIGIGIAMFQNARNEQYPESLVDLMDAGYIEDPRIFVSPTDPAPRPIGDGGYRTSYEYVGGLPPNVPPGVIMAYTRQGIYPDGRNVLNADIAVLWASEWDIHQPGGGVRTSLRASYDAVRAAYGDALTPEIDARLRKFYEIPG